ncbi:MAG TPA: 4a-hydroxytetrahydrobiopterin dehydratase [Kiritimatiellia bacterium]|nr:4a-hydroxytetrahydrobiopterin dehydratase [Kiritimatiellia bacterium]
MTKSNHQLLEKRCVPCEGGTPPLAEPEIENLLPLVPGWSVENHELSRVFSFKNYYQTTAFVNAVAWIAHREDHHPDISFGYKACTIRYSTHSVGGLTENDFICAAKINALL